MTRRYLNEVSSSRVSVISSYKNSFALTIFFKLRFRKIWMSSICAMRQCDHAESLRFQFWPFSTMKLCPLICQSRLKNCPNWINPKKLTKGRNFAKSGHTGDEAVFWRKNWQVTFGSFSHSHSLSLLSFIKSFFFSTSLSLSLSLPCVSSDRHTLTYYLS